mmetsp:Transcript_11245/g.35673  ORF Transcript_11245/g.35673 Transcript_11245/m.35673 type:complete len:361 (-) Transcript_11245:210-1292(-)
MIPTAQVVAQCDAAQVVNVEQTVGTPYYVAEGEKMRILRGMNVFPDGLCEQFRASCAGFARRIWIIDNSGSMGRTDGKRLVTKNGATRTVKSSRWDELGDSLRFHAAIAANLGAPTEFRLLNPPPGCRQVVELGLGYRDEELAAAEAVISSSPLGRTPLCASVREVIANIRVIEPELRSTGQRALVVIASDGEPSDGDVEVALRPLKDLPVNVVVRLCTDEDTVVDFWSTVDADLEFPLDVLDDLASEAREVVNHNPYIAYGLPLHRLREFGCALPIVDLIDETRLAPTQLKQLAVVLYGQAAADLPHPDLDFKDFVRELDRVQRSDPGAKVWDPLRKRVVFWLNLDRLARVYGVQCTIA